MGNTFYIYSRNKKSQRWESNYLAGDENLIKKFKLSNDSSCIFGDKIITINFD